MLVELGVKNLGVIESARVPFDEGLVALTGETGAGKTMLVEALNLLAGHRADPSRVRQGSTEAVVEGLFAVGDVECVLRRVVPASGRSRAYVNGDLATVATLAETAAALMELHGQHAQQALFARRAHREALDEYGAIDTGPLDHQRSTVRAMEAEVAGLGGDESARLREIDLLRFQLDEIDAADLRVGEYDDLALEEATLAGAIEHREAASTVFAALGSDGGVVDRLSEAVAVLEGRVPFGEISSRLRGIATDLADCTSVVRDIGESIEPDPERLARVQARRAQLFELQRKYGGSEAAVLEYGAVTRKRLDGLAGHDERLQALTQQLEVEREALLSEAGRVGSARRASAPLLAAEIERHLAVLAMPDARIEILVEDTPGTPGDGGSVEFLISTNPGVRPGPLSKVASGGELSRVMLALRLVLSQSPPTAVFDEIDAGIGGEAAIEVGRALADLAARQQVLVVTHLPQVAAFADVQVRLEKSVGGGSVSTTATALSDEERVIELSRMLSGQPDSDTARSHARDLLERRRRVDRSANVHGGVR